MGMSSTIPGVTRAGACEGKEGFDSAALAWTAAKRRPGRVAYLCGFCGLHHVGREHGPKQKPKRRIDLKRGPC